MIASDSIYVSNNFLTMDQIIAIREKVYSLENYYRPVKNDVPNDIDVKKFCAHTLGNAVYAHRSLDTKLNDIMIDNFSNLFDMTIDAIQKIFNIKNLRLANFSVPGFHIFRGVELSYYLKSLHYHVDKNILDHPSVDIDTVDTNFLYSFASIIENTKEPSFLDYKNDKFYYQYGNLNIWNGMMPHRIGGNEFIPTDTRITYQGHVYKKKGADEYYLYF